MEKIVPLGRNLPVAVTVFGRADFVGAPWSLLLETFAQSIGDSEAPHLETYLSRLISFLESDHPLVSGDAESDEFVRWAITVLRPLVRDVARQHGNPESWADEAWDTLRASLATDISRPHPVSGRLGNGFGHQVTTTFAGLEERYTKVLFGVAVPPDDVRASLTSMLSRKAESETADLDTTGLVFVGYGQSDHYPRCIELRVETKLAGRVRYSLGMSNAISSRNRSCIATFAQSEMVEAFLHGMTIDAWAEARDVFEQVLEEFFGEEVSDYTRRVVADEIARRLMVFTNEEYTRPLEEAAAVLPVEELADLARTLVSLAAFRSRLSVVETGSVGGELRVCTITKHHGVRWTKP